MYIILLYIEKKKHSKIYITIYIKLYIVFEKVGCASIAVFTFSVCFDYCSNVVGLNIRTNQGKPVLSI